MQHEPTLGELLRDLWRAKIWLLAGGLIGLAGAVFFMAVSVPHYRASMLVAPAERGTGPDIKALLPDNSSFAVQYMMNAIGSADSADYVRFEHMLRGPSVAAQLVGDTRIVEGAEKDRRFSFDASEKIDSAQKLADYLEDHVDIEPVGNTPLRRIVYKHADPAFAGYLLQEIYKAADDLIREEIRSKTLSRTDYLQHALETVDHPDHRRALTSLLMEQEHVRMILAMDEPFAAIIAEPPAAGVKPYWPRGAVVFPLFVMAGLMLGYMIYAARRETAA